MKIFVLLSRFPYPLEKGDKLRVFNQIKELSKNHEIILCALTVEKVAQSSIDILSKYCSSIEVVKLSKIKIYLNLLKCLLFTNKSLQVAYFYNSDAQKKIDSYLLKYEPDHIYCQLIRVTEYVRKSNIKKTLDYMDALARGMERRIEDAPFYLKWFLKIETDRLKRYEHFIFNDFDSHTIISEQDRKLIVNVNNDEIVIVKNGVDYETYKHGEANKEYDLIFTGNMGYPPNVDSVVYLVNNVMPLVWKQQPDIKLAIVGAQPVAKVLKLKSEKVVVTGWVEDISEYYSKSKVFIAPMQIGTGLQNKLLEAMAMKLPCITSQLANNALGAIHNKNILIGNNPTEYTQHIIRLMDDVNLQKELAQKGHQFVKENYTWEANTSILEKLIISTQ
ncbi:MAG: glycosyltransferase [Flavobacteriales bacterium]|nr:glycosyltransferase [Flavobacteriales bacterium]NQX97416.1 glycosyltransferase [Flavobacteriales bacterium]